MYVLKSTLENNPLDIPYLISLIKLCLYSNTFSQAKLQANTHLVYNGWPWQFVVSMTT